MGDTAVVTEVQPVFKLEKPDGTTEIPAGKFLHPLRFGIPHSLAAGGAYLLDKDGKPRDPAAKDKPKPIPVARYVFHLADHLLTDDELSKITRGDCFETVTLEDKPGATVTLQAVVPDAYFIMGTDHSETNQFYASAEHHFLWELGIPPKWITKPSGGAKAISLVELFGKIDAISDKFRDVVLVSHANLHGWLGFPLETGETEPVGFESLTKKLDDGGLPDLSSKVVNRVIIRGCNIGQSPDMLKLLAKAFGSACTVFAPTHKQSYKNDFEVKKSKVTKAKSWEYFYTYWVQEKGVTKKTDAVLLDAMKARYPETDPDD